MISLDTSFVVELLREAAARREGPATRRLAAAGDEALALSVFVLCELEAGAARARDTEGERARVAQVVARCEVLYPDERFPSLYGGVAARLLGRGRRPPVMDILIGLSSALAGATLITRERRGFTDIPDLRVERV
ncbi:MAG: type II toxin-antitoxin system VapC family toxin [Planctomycetes bacterium]|nr:type II toxin-antitoxin system VapC family toxin [Planctomycetota bacterium]